MKKLLILLFCLLPIVAHGAATERGFTIEYTEPTETATTPPTPLDDLAGTKIYMDVIVDGVAGTVDTINPTAKTGGGKISKKYCVKILDDTTAKTIEISVTAFDESGNESEHSPTIVHQVAGTRDCTVPDTTAPAIPSNLHFVP